MKDPYFIESISPIDPDVEPTEAEKRFVHHYVQHLNLADAARSIGVASHLASATAWRIIARPRVRAFIADLLRERNVAEGYTDERVLQEYITLAYSNIVDYVTPDSEGEPRLDWEKIKANPRLGAAIQEIITETKVIGDPSDGGYEMTRVKFKLHPKLPALESMAKILKLLDNAKPDAPPLLQGTLSAREIARSIAWALSLGMRAPVTIVQEKADDFADLT